MTDAPSEREGEGAWTKLRHRKVVQWGLAYAAAAWTLLQVLEYLTETYSWPPAIRQIATPALALGLLFVLVLAWYHGDKGAQQISRPELAMLATLVVIVGGTLWWYVSRLDESAWVADTAVPAIKRAAPTDARPSIAVLPFENRSAKQDDAFFVDGIHDDILTKVASIGELKVIAHTSVEQFRNTSLTSREIGEKLGVTRILEGGVQRSGDRVRINVQLIDAATDDHLWAESYDRELTAANVFAIQSEVAAAIAAALKATLTPMEKARANAIPTRNLEAWEAYQIGKQRLAKRTTANLADAERFFQKAIDLDPRFALAWAGLADSIALQVTYGGAPREATHARAEKAAASALEMDPSLAEAWATAAFIASERQQYERSEPMFRRAIALNPNDAAVIDRFAYALGAEGRLDEALVYAKKAAELDPLSAIIIFHVGLQLYYLARFDEALDWFGRAIEIDPLMSNSYKFAGLSKAYGLGRPGEAVRWSEKASELDPGALSNEVWVATEYLDLGDQILAQHWIDRAVKRKAASAFAYTDTAAALVALCRGDEKAARNYAAMAVAIEPTATAALSLLRNRDLATGDLAAARDRYAAAFPELAEATPVKVDGRTLAAAIDLALVLQRMGERERARQLLDTGEAFVKTSQRLSHDGYGLADVRIHALRGDKDKALAALREAEKAGWRGPFWRYYRDFDPNLASIRNDPEFKAVFADIERDMARQRAELAARPKDAPLALGSMH